MENKFLKQIYFGGHTVYEISKNSSKNFEIKPLITFILYF
jgi:hypothetical protein